MEDESAIHNRTELDMLLTNIEVAVKVKTRPDFFFWVQGVFQGMIAHEALVCGIPDLSAHGLRFEWLGSFPIEQERFEELCSRDGGLLHALLAAWARGGQVALLLGATPSADVEPSVVEVLRRQDLSNAVIHGLPGLDGSATAFFAFFKLPGAPSTREPRMLELLLPYLYTAWLRANCDKAGRAGARSAAAPDILTTREVEILNWVERGKSNSEIAQILSISPLTVKNHVQKILRKLDVQNRAQAVAKGINLNITRGAGGVSPRTIYGR